MLKEMDEQMLGEMTPEDLEWAREAGLLPLEENPSQEVFPGLMNVNNTSPVVPVEEVKEIDEGVGEEIGEEVGEDGLTAADRQWAVDNGITVNQEQGQQEQGQPGVNDIKVEEPSFLEQLDAGSKEAEANVLYEMAEEANQTGDVELRDAYIRKAQRLVSEAQGVPIEEFSITNPSSWVSTPLRGAAGELTRMVMPWSEKGRRYNEAHQAGVDVFNDAEFEMRQNINAAADFALWGADVFTGGRASAALRTTRLLPGLAMTVSYGGVRGGIENIQKQAGETGEVDLRETGSAVVKGMEANIVYGGLPITAKAGSSSIYQRTKPGQRNTLRNEIESKQAEIDNIDAEGAAIRMDEGEQLMGTYGTEPNTSYSETSHGVFSSERFQREGALNDALAMDETYLKQQAERKAELEGEVEGLKGRLSDLEAAPEVKRKKQREQRDSLINVDLLEGIRKGVNDYGLIVDNKHLEGTGIPRSRWGDFTSRALEVGSEFLPVRDTTSFLTGKGTGQKNQKAFSTWRKDIADSYGAIIEANKHKVNTDSPQGKAQLAKLENLRRQIENGIVDSGKLTKLNKDAKKQAKAKGIDNYKRVVPEDIIHNLKQLETTEKAVKPRDVSIGTATLIEAGRLLATGFSMGTTAKVGVGSRLGLAAKRKNLKNAIKGGAGLTPAQLDALRKMKVGIEGPDGNLYFTQADLNRISNDILTAETKRSKINRQIDKISKASDKPLDKAAKSKLLKEVDKLNREIANRTLLAQKVAIDIASTEENKDKE